MTNKPNKIAHQEDYHGLYSTPRYDFPVFYDQKLWNPANCSFLYLILYHIYQHINSDGSITVEDILFAYPDGKIGPIFTDPLLGNINPTPSEHGDFLEKIKIGDYVYVDVNQLFEISSVEETPEILVFKPLQHIRIGLDFYIPGSTYPKNPTEEDHVLCNLDNRRLILKKRRKGYFDLLYMIDMTDWWKIVDSSHAEITCGTV